MKILSVVLGLLLLTVVYVPAQGLLDIYLMLPDQDGLVDQRTRKRMVSNYESGRTEPFDSLHYRLKVVDKANGFLEVNGAMEGVWQMCYWNLGDKKLVAVYAEGCGPLCDVETFKFFALENGKLKEQEIETIIPGYGSIYKNFCIAYTADLGNTLKKEDVLVTMLFELPRKGKNIVVKFGNADSRRTYEKYFKGDRMTLTWNNGTFLSLIHI